MARLPRPALERGLREFGEQDLRADGGGCCEVRSWDAAACRMCGGRGGIRRVVAAVASTASATVTRRRC
ncbi:unnamed protein product [Lampetra fluviatilis]